jgi:hypothetical protein
MFIAAPTTSSTPSTSNRAPVPAKPSLTRAQPIGRAPPRVPVDPSHDKSRSPFSVSYSRTSGRSSGSRTLVVEAAAIEAAIAQAQAQQQQPRLTLAGLTSLIPWGMGGAAKSAPSRVVQGVEQRTLISRKENGTVSREAQLARLRREMQSGKVSSEPCCSRCKSDVIQL